MRNIYKAIIGLIVLLIVMINPFTREILWFLVIPTGWDDLIVYGIGIALGVLFITGLVNGTIQFSIKGLWEWLSK